MTDFTRYAIFYAPPPGPLADFLAAWLGWDPAAGRAVAPPVVDGLPAPVADLTAAPRRYGGHGTLKPPFRLAGGKSAADLAVDVGTLAGRLAPLRLDGLELAQLGGFLALMPVGDASALGALAGAVVTGLDAFRAPAGKAELARRRAAGLSPRQEANLTRWGYPYVREEFRFHITLTGKLDSADAAATRAALAPRLAPLLPAPFEVADICLFGERAGGRFHLIHRYPLTG